MSAMNGRHGRLVGLAVAIVFALSALLASSAGAIPPKKETYMALGDSLAFGYSTQQLNEGLLVGDPASGFEHGYDHYYFVHLKPILNGVQEANLGCPGETTKSMIGEGPLGAALGGGFEAPCAYHEVTHLPLHVEYGGGKSQLEKALEELGVNAFLGTPVTSVTLNIGANDELHGIGKCEAEVKFELETEGKSKYWSPEGPFTPEAAVENCIVAHVPEIFNTIISNTGKVLFVLRKGAEFGSVNYTGKVAFLFNYDPYGNLCGPPSNESKLLVPTAVCRAAFKMKEGQHEILEGSKNLAALLNAEMQAHLSSFGVCWANPASVFNTATKTEPERLQTLTNMVNFSETNGQKNGPDIHPTPLGYKKLNAILVKACP